MALLKVSNLLLITSPRKRKISEEHFSFESILLLFRLRRRAVKNERSAFMGPNTKHVHAYRQACYRNDWQKHFDEIRKVKEEDRHVKQTRSALQMDVLDEQFAEYEVFNPVAKSVIDDT